MQEPCHALVQYVARYLLAQPPPQAQNRAQAGTEPASSRAAAVRNWRRLAREMLGRARGVVAELTCGLTWYRICFMKILDVPQSGSVAGVTSSRNRFGQYRRTRATPVNPNSTFQGAVRNRLSSNSADLRGLTDTQRSGWESLGSMIARTDSLGQTYTLTGFQAFCSVNNNKLAAGDAVVTTAPAIVTPTGLVTSTITLTAASFSIAYTATPLGAGVRLFVFASPQRSAGRVYEGDYRLVSVTAAAAASPADVFSAYQTRLGTPVVGNRIFLQLQTYEGGFLSGPLSTSAVVSA